MSTGQELESKMDSISNIPRAFKWVIASSASSALTIGEMNRKKGMCRAAEWLTLVCVPPIFIFAAAGAASIPYSGQTWSSFPWWLPILLLAGVYPAVVFLAMGHITLFLPEAPYAAREALINVGYKRIGFAVAASSPLSMLLVDHPWVLIAWACLRPPDRPRCCHPCLLGLPCSRLRREARSYRNQVV